jgi:hypothetical protein
MIGEDRVGQDYRKTIQMVFDEWGRSRWSGLKENYTNSI